MTQVLCCIFDMDGLLLDTERIYTEATQVFLDRHAPGTTFTWELKSKLMGRGTQESARIFMDSTGIQMPIDDFMNENMVIQTELFATTKVLPGVERLIRHLHEHNIPMAVATSSPRSKIIGLFDSITCGDDAGVEKGKPAPDIFLEAHRKLGHHSPEHCLVFEDALSGIEAARNAKMRAIWIPDPNLLALPREEEFVEPTETLTSMEDFDPSKYGLPPWGCSCAGRALET
ncbi:HAD-like domain-containing protein [Cantharellus anzutake]|uniref:HAD-like domain-containing protein n=1 Tax=Cantharellus anzutake TaxID=1750568 RepID=UPI0019056495|nr:HAD-like domain-containing protein [Cantharellus anzutake]KAF8331394.1 HAD-like domain-containing protein [Cantharellus anzutake]